MNIALTPIVGLMLAMPAKSDITKPSTAFSKDPQIVSIVKPAYPEFARLRQFQGVVVVKLWLDESGKPRNARIVESASPVLEEAAIKAAMSSEFSPAFGPAGPMKSVVEIPFSFKIR